MKIYIVLEDWATDFESSSSLKAFSTFEKAKDYLEERRSEEKENEANDDCVYEDYENSFSYYEEGYYCENHIGVSLKEIEVE